jgi:hypothetical protein
MKIGFTGTREGMTTEQIVKFVVCITEFEPTTFRHGCCVGADEQAAVAVRQIRGESCQIIGHPAPLGRFVSDKAERQCDDVLPDEPPLDRNHRIVDMSDFLIACPKGPEEQRSGTWATIRFARKVGKPVIIIAPDGEYEGHNIEDAK